MKNKLLLVEDEIDLQQNIKDILEFYDFEVVTADNGMIAVGLLKNHNFDLVISDIMMPEMDGFELLIEVRNNQKLINLPFIFLTAKVEKDDLRKGMEYGAEDYLTKPVHSKDLVNAVNAAIKKKKEREEWLTNKIETVLQDERNVKYHELRTPLFGLMSILELLSESLGTIDYDQLKELLDTAYSASIRLNESLLNLARYHSLKNYKPSKDVIPSVETVIRECLKLSKNNFELVDGIDFQVEFDKDSFIFILKELIFNADKFATDDPIYINFGPKSIWIANFQQSISAAQDFRIEPFSQINRKFYEQQGLGLGLYLSQEYALKNNASLKARITEELMFTVELRFE